MRRPLLYGSFCLVALIAFIYCRGPAFAGSGPPDGTHIIVTGRVCDKDDNSFDIQIYNVSILNSSVLNDAAASQQINPSKKTNKKLQCMYDDGKQPVLGSEVMLEGTFATFSKATNPGEFDYAHYYTSMGYLGRLRNTKVLKQRGESGFQEALYELRCHWESRLYDILPRKEASVMAAILLGVKGNVDADIKSLYERNGIVHILSISGLHITIIGIGIYKLLRKVGLSVGAAALCGGTVLVLYGFMTGFGVSVCRAIGMYLLRMLGQLWGRTYDMLTALGFVGALMALFRPAWLGHMGYLLSFGSVLGLGLLVPALSKENAFGQDETVAGRKPERFVEGRLRRGLAKLWKFIGGLLKEGLLSGLCITLTTLPIQLWFSYEISIYSVLLNALILPLMSAVMISGLVAMLVPGLGIVGTVDVVILSGYEGLCHAFEALPAAMWNPGRPAVWQVVIYYCAWAVVVWILPHVRKRKPGKLAQFALLAAAVGILALPKFRGDRVTFLDVGQGDCICVQLSTGETYLFDCGSSSRRGVGEDVLIPFLKYYGIQEIDAVFASHGDSDHVSGLEELLTLAAQEHITVKQLVLPTMRSMLLEEEFDSLLQAADAACVPVQVMAAGETWGSGAGATAEGADCDRFLCLHPSEDYTSTGGNAGSQCFYVKLQEGRLQLSLLLTGDVEADGEEELLMRLKRYGIESVDVLKVGHHGSKNSSAEEFLEQVQPRLSVISCGRNNSYGHPHEEAIERLIEVGSEILTTPDCGAITIEIGEEIKVYGYCFYEQNVV